NNVLGLMQAEDSILLETLGTTFDQDHNVLSKATLDAFGGLFKSRNLLIRSPDGKISLTADEISGAVDVSGGTAVIGTTKGDLLISRMDLSGDPIYFSGGNL